MGQPAHLAIHILSLCLYVIEFSSAGFVLLICFIRLVLLIVLTSHIWLSVLIWLIYPM